MLNILPIFKLKSSMELIFRICLFISGLINFAPSLLAFMPDKIGKSYGIVLPDANTELLIRHRAVLFGIVGGLMIYAAISKNYYQLATVLGSISMISFLILYFLCGNINEELTKVMKIDVFAIVILLTSFMFFQWGKQ
jgi:hypothetical protein